MSINFSSFRNFAFLGEVGFFPYISCITCSTKTFPILSNLSSHGPGKYVKHGIYAALRTSSARLSLRTKIKLYQRYIERDFSWSMQNCIHDFKTKEMLHCFLFHLGNTLLKEGRYIIYFFNIFFIYVHGYTHSLQYLHSYLDYLQKLVHILTLFNISLHTKACTTWITYNVVFTYNTIRSLTILTIQMLTW